MRPGASRTRVGGRYDGPYGPALVVAVTAPPVDGRATEAVLRAVADALGVKARDLAVRSGTASRDKLLAVTDPPADLADRVAELLALAPLARARGSSGDVFPPRSARQSRRRPPRADLRDSAP